MTELVWNYTCKCGQKMSVECPPIKETDKSILCYECRRKERTQIQRVGVMGQANVWEYLLTKDKPMTLQEIATALDISPTFVQESIRGLRMRRVIITTVRGEGCKGRNQYELNERGRREGKP